LMTGTTSRENIHLWGTQADVLARYFLAVPGAILATIALFSQASQRRRSSQGELSNTLKWAAMGFAFYGISQIIVTPLNFFPASILNTENFLQITRFPVQIPRTIMAVTITVSLIRAMQIVEKQRQGELLLAQQDRLDALEQVQEELLKQESMRRELLRHTVITQEEERTRISRELHDETAQILTAFSLDVATLQGLSCEDPEIVNVTTRLQSLSKKMSRSLKSLVQDLRPAQLDDLGIVSAIKSLIDENTKHADLQVQFDVQGVHLPLDPLVETVLFRVTQEALTNIIRHAQVRNAEIELTYAIDEVCLQVSDQGVGYDIGERHPTQIGWGIAGMRERIRSVSGEFNWTSKPGSGTTVRISIPTYSSSAKEDFRR